MSAIAKEIGEITSGETRRCVADFTFAFTAGSGEKLTGTPTVVEYGIINADGSVTTGTSALTLANKAVSTEAFLHEDGTAIEKGKAVVFTAVSASGTVGRRYRVKVTASTDHSVAQTLVRYVDLEIV